MTTTTYYKYLKLTNGDNIICKTTKDYKSITRSKSLTVKQPVVLSQIRMPRNNVLIESYIMYPLFSFAVDDLYEIPVNQIVVATNIKDSLKENYEEYLTQREEADKDVTEEFTTDINELEASEEDDDLDIDELEDELITKILEGDNDENSDTRGGRANRRTIH
jgi:hypothetical protein